MRRSVRSIPTLVETPNWNAAPTLGARKAAAIAWLLQGQRETGYEHVVILTLGGELVHAGTSGFGHRVAIPSKQDRRDVVIHHSHPTEASLSPADFTAARRWSAASEVQAHTPQGATFYGRSHLDPSRWIENRACAGAALASELRILDRRDRRSYVDLAFHIANLEMEALGLVWYKADLSEAARDALAQLRSDLPTLRAPARQELRRDGRS